MPIQDNHLVAAGDEAPTKKVLGIENTDLERRVLAHERILQALIAQMAESEPKFIEQLLLVFGDPVRVGRSEHDYIDTNAYAAQFLQGVLRLGINSDLPEKERTTIYPSGDKTGPSTLFGDEPTAIEVRRRSGIWEVTRDGAFFGQFHQRQPAVDAAAAAVFAIVASGGRVKTFLEES